jgi:hypothetical protein
MVRPAEGNSTWAAAETAVETENRSPSAAHKRQLGFQIAAERIDERERSVGQCGGMSSCRMNSMGNGLSISSFTSEIEGGD